MRQWNTFIATLIVIASSPVTADDTPGFYSGAGAGYMPAGELNLQLTPAVGSPTVGTPTAGSPAVGNTIDAFGGFRLNSQFGLEGFYVDINPMSQLSARNKNLYTQSFHGTHFGDEAISTVAGVSVVTTLVPRGPVRPFARTGLHYYDVKGGSGLPLRNGSLLFGAGADIDLSKGWNARLEWERYSDVDRLDKNLFSARFEYKF